MTTAQACQSEDLSKKIRAGVPLSPGDRILPHPAALKFHKLSAHRESLQKSLRDHGQLTEATIWFDNNQPLLCDGNTRRQLLAEDGKSLVYRMLKPEELHNRTIEEWILEKNLNGSLARHLTDTQRALQTAEFESEVRAAAKTRMKSGKAATEGEVGRTEELLAKIAGCKPSRVRQAIELKSKADRALYEAVWEGSISISTGLGIVSLVDEVTRRTATSAAKAGDKKTLKRLLRNRTHDDLRQTIPTTLQPVFEEASLFDQACRQIHAALATLRQTTAPGIDLNKLCALANTLQDQKPYCVCPYCAGTRDDCHVCENNRWLTVVRYETVRNDDIARRRNRS